MSAAIIPSLRAKPVTAADLFCGRKPLCIDLFCGLGGWTEGFLAEGYDVLGFDVERHHYGELRYPAQLVLQDVRTLQGSQFKDAAVIVASPPCQRYSYMAMPWKRAKEMAARYRKDIGDLNELFDACFRIQREASEAAGRHIPLVVENVKGAQPWVGRAAWHFGSFYLWGDMPALMPISAHRKVPGMNFHEHEKTGQPGRSFQSAAVEMGRKGPGGDWFKDGRQGQDACAEGIKNAGGSWFAIGSPGQANTGQNPDGRKVPGLDWSKFGKAGYKAQGFNVTAAQRIRQEGLKFGGGWWHDSTNNLIRKASSRSSARKAASAQIAKIPFPLSSWIAKCFLPSEALCRELLG